MKTCTIISLALALMTAGAAAKDLPDSKDHPLVGRYARSEIVFYKVSDFDARRLLDRPLDVKTAGENLTGENSRLVEGKVFNIRYLVPKDRSSLEVFRNYESSLAAKGFETIFTCQNEQCLAGSTSFYRLGSAVDEIGANFRYQKSVRYLLARLARPEGEVYAAILVGEHVEPVVRVSVVEVKPIESGKITFIDASAMEKAIGVAGRVALYGVQFDHDKAEIKPDSKPTLDEIVKFMQANPKISIIVAGHTDNLGGFEYNLDLSRRRAGAVVAALVRQGGIAPGRLTPFGAGMAAPVALNDDEAGRARNRRVELVKR
jgi:OmpA-OmpF porin, OOP family